MAITSFTPQIQDPRFSSLVYPKVVATSYADTATVTAAELLGGLLIDTKAGTMTLTLPTAALINAAIPGPFVGLSFDFAVRNTGNNTGTVAVGTGITSASGNTLTVATLSTRLFKLVCTGVASENVAGSTDTYALYCTGIGLH